jgi:carbon-monoxide dehydrogenase small subunit
MKDMKQRIKLRVNGVEEEVFVEPWWTLARVLREELNLTGTKVSCETGNCGSCTVLVNGMAMKSCLYLAMKARDKDVLTIEGVKDEKGRLHPIQEAFIEYFAVQCGYCTPGMIMAAMGLLAENPTPTEEEVREELRGNLCRCTGYVKIVEAVLAAAGKMK